MLYPTSKHVQKFVATSFVCGSLVLSAQQASSATLDWDNHNGGANGWTAGATSANITADGVAFDMNITGDLKFNGSNRPSYVNATGGYSYGNPTANGAFILDANFDTIDERLVYTVNFSEALNDFSFGVLDIDARFSSNGAGNYYSAFRDTVTVTGFGLDGKVYASVTLDPLYGGGLYHSVQGKNNNKLVASQTDFDLRNPLNNPLTRLIFDTSVAKCWSYFGL